MKAQTLLSRLAHFIVIVFLPRLARRPRRTSTLTTDELKRKLDAGEDVLVLDVRSAQEFCGEQGHIAEARNIPLEELATRTKELESDRRQPIALVCRTDKRSTVAAAQLAAKGFAKVHVTRGGMTEWCRRDYAVAR